VSRVDLGQIDAVAGGTEVALATDTEKTLDPGGIGPACDLDPTAPEGPGRPGRPAE